MLDDDGGLSEVLGGRDHLVFNSAEDEAAAMGDYSIPNTSSNPNPSEEDDSAEVFGDEDGDTPDGFPPKLSDYQEADLSKQSLISVDKARSDIFQQYQKEYHFITSMIDKLPDTDGTADERRKVANLLLGPKSKVYQVFQEALDLPYHKFAQFMATFYFVCRFNQNWKDLWNDPDINTKRFMPTKIFYRILRRIDEYGRGESFSTRFWEELQEALNNVMAKYFIPRKFEDRMTFDRFLLTMDDDKNHYAYGAMRDVKVNHDSHLKRARHVRDNRKGFNNHVVAYAASDIPIISMFEHEDHDSLFDCVLDIMKSFFKKKNPDKLNLSGQATLAVDRGYMRLALLSWWLSTGGDIIGTVMRGMNWVPYTFGDEKKKKQATESESESSKDGPQFIPVNGFRDVYQKTAAVNIGKKKSGEKNRALTCMAFRNGFSSSIALHLSSRKHDIEWDIVLMDAKSLARYQNYHKMTWEYRFMHGFYLLDSTNDDDR